MQLQAVFTVSRTTESTLLERKQGQLQHSSDFPREQKTEKRRKVHRHRCHSLENTWTMMEACVHKCTHTHACTHARLFLAVVSIVVKFETVKNFEKQGA